MKTKQILIAVVGVLIVGGVSLFFFLEYQAKTKQSGQISTEQQLADQQSTEQNAVLPDTKIVPTGLPDGYKVTIENAPDCGVIKSHVGEQYSYDFFCKEKVLEHVDMVGNWRVEPFLSYEGGNELLGFFKAGSGEDKKYYWGPSILYKMNTEKGTVKKFLDASSAIVQNNTQSLFDTWGTKYFITDVSKDGTLATYSNYFAVNTIFVRDMVTGKIQEFKVDKSLYDFGDASFSDDGSQIAFAGMKRRVINDKDTSFVEAELFILDLKSGKITLKEKNTNPGMYTVNGWDKQNVSFDYLDEVKGTVK